MFNFLFFKEVSLEDVLPPKTIIFLNCSTTNSFNQPLNNDLVVHQETHPLINPSVHHHHVRIVLLKLYVVAKQHLCVVNQQSLVDPAHGISPLSIPAHVVHDYKLLYDFVQVQKAGV